MKAYVINNGSFYTEQIIELLMGWEVKPIPLGEISTSAIEAGSLVVLSGGHIIPVQRHDREYAKEIELIKHHQGPVVGICLGAQLIAHVFGDHLHLMAKNHKGIIAIHPTQPGEKLFSGTKQINVYENHHLSIVKLNQPLISLAESDDGIEVFKHRDKPIYGIQFHPEVLKDNNGAQLFGAILNSIPDR